VKPMASCIGGKTDAALFVWCRNVWRCYCVTGRPEFVSVGTLPVTRGKMLLHFKLRIFRPAETQHLGAGFVKQIPI
ncbi:MAG: hypothetical protein WCC26_17060, partial [Terracidiphilus sp.]